MSKTVLEVIGCTHCQFYNPIAPSSDEICRATDEDDKPCTNTSTIDLPF